MNEDEVEVAFNIDTSDKQRNQLETVIKVTGGVPRQVENLVAAGFDVEKYTSDEAECIGLSWNELRRKSCRDEIDDLTSNAVACVLSRPEGHGTCFDYNHLASRGRTG